MNETKKFPLRVVLTLVTGRLVTVSKGPKDNGIGDLYELLGWMTNDQPFTHQLPRFGEECKPWLLRWFPELLSTTASGTNLDAWRDRSTCPEEAIKMWLTELKMMFPALKDEYEVPRIPQDDHERKNPFDELVIMRGTDEGIITVD